MIILGLSCRDLRPRNWTNVYPNDRFVKRYLRLQAWQFLGHSARCVPPVKLQVVNPPGASTTIGNWCWWLMASWATTWCGSRCTFNSTNWTTWTQKSAPKHHSFWRFNPEIFRIMLGMGFSCVTDFGNEKKTLQLSTTQCCASNPLLLCVNFASLQFGSIQ